MKKQRHYFADKGPSSQTYGFSGSYVWMWELDSKESWAQKKWCFWTGVLEKTLDSLLSSRRWIQFILKDISPEHSLEGLMLELKFQQSGHLMWKTDSLEKTQMVEILIAGFQVGDRGWVSWISSLTRCRGVWSSSRSCWWTGKPTESSGNFPKIKELISGSTERSGNLSKITHILILWTEKSGNVTEIT